MHEAPKDLSPADVSSYLARHWGIEAREVSYVPLGAGSHNWVAVGTEKWFIKIDPCGEGSEFTQECYRSLRSLFDAGLKFVLAPIPDLSGELKPRVSDQWEIGVFPFLEGRNPDFANSTERVLVGQALGKLHALRPVPEALPRWTPGYLQPELRAILAEQLGRPWREGPLAERARAMFIQAEKAILRLMAFHDELAARVQEDDELWVATVGEPHDGNTFLGNDGTAHLIDVSAPSLAPRELDLRVLLNGGHGTPGRLDNTEVLAAYRKITGEVAIRDWALELYRAEWNLIEIARCAREFSGPHGGSAVGWHVLNSYLPIEENWPALR